MKKELMTARGSFIFVLGCLIWSAGGMMVFHLGMAYINVFSFHERSLLVGGTILAVIGGIVVGAEVGYSANKK